MTLYYVRLGREIEKAYLFLAETERDAEEYADDLRRADPEAVTRELLFWKDAEKWVDEGSYPPPSFAGKLRPKCIDGPLARQSISTERPDQVMRAYRHDKDGHHGTYVLEVRENASGYYWYPGEVERMVP
jgi:hypothetical protein